MNKPLKIVAKLSLFYLAILLNANLSAQTPPPGPPGPIPTDDEVLEVMGNLMGLYMPFFGDLKAEELPAVFDGMRRFALNEGTLSSYHELADEALGLLWDRDKMKEEFPQRQTLPYQGGESIYVAYGYNQSKELELHFLRSSDLQPLFKGMSRVVDGMGNHPRLSSLSRAAENLFSARKLERLDILLQEADAYLEEIDQSGQYQISKSGLRYQILNPGNDERVDLGQYSEERVLVDYSLYMSDGTLLESSEDSNWGPSIRPFMKEALGLVGLGGQINLVVHPEVGYGLESTVDSIPDGAVLLYNISIEDLGDHIPFPLPPDDIINPPPPPGFGTSFLRISSSAQAAQGNGEVVMVDIEASGHWYFFASEDGNNAASWVSVDYTLSSEEQLALRIAPNTQSGPRAVSLQIGLIPDGRSQVLEITQEAGTLWQGARESDGWIGSDWFGWFAAQEYPGVQHLEHGYLFLYGNDPSSFHYFDVGLNSYFWTGETLYPWIYRFGQDQGWYYYFRGGAPGERWFYKVEDGSYIIEGNM